MVYISSKSISLYRHKSTIIVDNNRQIPSKTNLFYLSIIIKADLVLMAYKHKREKCAKETKEILENVLMMKQAEYETIDCAKTVTVSSPMGRIVNEETIKNVLPSGDEEQLSESESSSIPILSKGNDEIEGIEDYIQTIEVDCKEVKAKEIFESTRKKRNYIDARDDKKR